MSEKKIQNLQKEIQGILAAQASLAGELKQLEIQLKALGIKDWEEAKKSIPDLEEQSKNETSLLDKLILEIEEKLNEYKNKVSSDED